jgi:hypothetical protein
MSYVKPNIEISSVKPNIVFDINIFNKYFNEVSDNTDSITVHQFSYFYIKYYDAFVTIGDIKSFFKILYLVLIYFLIFFFVNNL